MKVVVGSKNPAKMKAVKNAFAKYFGKVEVEGIEVESGVAAQPLSLDETVQGAITRAKAAWEKASGKCDYSVGIEAGMFPVKQTRTGYMDGAAVAVFDGEQVYLGLGPAFEYPEEVVEKVLNEGKEIGEVFQEMYGEDVNGEQGAIGLLSEGKNPRNALHEAGLIMALMQITNKKYYK